MHDKIDPKHIDLNGPQKFPVRLGIIGGGQLARMTASAALPLGVEVVVLEKSPASPAGRLSPDCIIGDWANPDTLLQFAAQCEVITLENEFVDAGALAVLEKAGYQVFPDSKCIATTQDKWAQKTALQKAGLAVPRFCAVNTPADITAAATQMGWPLVLKTRRNGYDGKGNYTLKSAADIEAGWQALGGGKNELMVEAWYPFVKELAVIGTCGRDGTTAVYPVVETIQRNHVCHVVKVPAPVDPALTERAAAMARQAVQAVGGIGSFGVRHDGGRIGIYQHHRNSFFPQTSASLRSRIIKFCRLADYDGARTNNQYFMNVVSFRHVNSLQKYFCWAQKPVQLYRNLEAGEKQT